VPALGDEGLQRGGGVRNGVGPGDAAGVEAEFARLAAQKI